jgi:ubiquinol-cytochrome c reductase iron-sulfur subunit
LKASYWKFMNRRTLLHRIVQGFTFTGLGFLAYPFLRAFIPTFAEDVSLDIDVSKLAEGESKTVSWLGRNLYVIRRSAHVTELLGRNNDLLKDPLSHDSRQPEFAHNQFRSKRPAIFIAYKNCTHLGCEVSSRADQPDAGFDCPCHNSRFDPSGRVHKDAVASFNLEVPDYEYVSNNLIRLNRS